MATLRGQSDVVQGQAFSIDEPETTIGRHDTNNIVIDDLSVSSFHCSVVRDGEKYTVHDLDSTNGVRVGGKKIAVRLLSPGDVVIVGSVELVFEVEGATEAAPQAVAAAPAAEVKTAATPIVHTQAGAGDAFKASAGKGKGLWIMIGIAALVGVIGVIGLIVILIGLR